MSDLYKNAGVDTTKADRLVDWLGSSEQQDEATELGKQVAGIGGFAGLFRPNFSGMKDPILVACTDGVGTKLLLGIEHNRLEGIGTDLVAMCINDLYCCGARPLFFIDYFATGKLNESQFRSVLTGIKSSLKQCKIPLLGGETAELPGLYSKNHFDLAGFTVGAVDGTKIIGPERVSAGDHIVAIASNGFHSNGFSLIRSWLASSRSKVSDDLLDKILTPTKIYSEWPQIFDSFDGVHAVANITGGGLAANLQRVIPDQLTAKIDAKKIQTPSWMLEFIEANGANFETAEPVLNMGIGMIAVVEADGLDTFQKLSDCWTTYPIGTITQRETHAVIIDD